MAEEPLVTVITVTRNRGDLLGRCIKSILGQTYSKLEYILVDGASTDNTDDVVATFVDSRLNYIKLEENLPVVETINMAIGKSHGEYVTFLDSDDEYLPEKLEKQVNLIKSLPEEYGFVYCWMTYYDDQTKNQLHLHNPQLRGFVGDDVVCSPVLSGTPTLMFKKDIICKLGGWKAPEEIGIVSDWELCARACQICKVDYIAESLVNVYENHGYVRQSDSKAYYNKSYERTIRFHKYFLNEFRENFNRQPKLQFDHFWTIFICSAHIRLYKQCFSFLIKSFLCSPIESFKKIFRLN